MEYTIDAHTKREKIWEDPKKGTGFKGVKETPGFLVRAENYVVAFVKTKEEANAIVSKEQANPSVVPNQRLEFEAHVKREKIWEKGPDGKEVFKGTKSTPGFNLRSGVRVIAWAETVEELKKKIKGSNSGNVPGPAGKGSRQSQKAKGGGRLSRKQGD